MNLIQKRENDGYVSTYFRIINKHSYLYRLMIFFLGHIY